MIIKNGQVILTVEDLLAFQTVTVMAADAAKLLVETLDYYEQAGIIDASERQEIEGGKSLEDN